MVPAPACRVLLRRISRLRPRQPNQWRRWNSSKPSPPKPPRQDDPIPVPNMVPAVPLWQRLGPLTRVAEAYARVQRSRPYATQVASSLVIYFCADISAQRIGGKDYDPVRTGRSLIIGSLVSIPAYEWFLFLSRSFNYPSHLLSLATKVIVNQAVFTPTFLIYFFGMQALLAGENLTQAVERIKTTVPVGLINSLKLWPAATAFSFAFVPLEFRSVFAGVVAVGWQTYLCYINRLAEEGRMRHENVLAKEAI